MIKKIHIKNFLSLQDVKLTLGETNVCVGANMTGKSALLKALKFLAFISISNLNQTVKDFGGFLKFFGKVKAYLKSYGLKAELVSLPGNFEENLVAQVKADQADLLAMGIPGEHFLDKFRETLHLQTNPVQRMVEETGAALFTVH